MLKIYPRKPALCAEGSTMELLVSIDPAELPGRRAKAKRTPVNLALILDRSGSMDGEKMHLTIEAACGAVSQLGVDDYAVAVAFDNEPENLYSGYVKEAQPITNLLRTLTAGGGTDLYAGWELGAKELRSAVHPSSISRAILLTDGQANCGVVDPETICRGVKNLAERGVQTTTLGFGSDYDERLLSEIARSGRGNHAYIENAQRVSSFFEEEMSSLLKTRATQLRLHLAPSENARVQFLAKLSFDASDRAYLADLVEGQALAVLIRLQAPSPEAEEPALSLTLHWHDVEQGETREEKVDLTLPLVNREQWDALPEHPEVMASLASHQAQSCRELATALLEMDMVGLALSFLDRALRLEYLPEQEVSVLKDLIETIERGDFNSSRKKMMMYSHGHGSGHAQVSSHYAQGPRPGGVLPSKNQTERQFLPLGQGDLLHQTARGRGPSRARVLAMLRGHFYGERLVRGNRSAFGEGAALSKAVLLRQLRSPFDPKSLAYELHQAAVLHPTTSLQKFRRKYQQGGHEILQLGDTTAGCAALRRMCPLLVGREGPLYLEAALATALTHRDNLAITASLGYLALLGQLLQQSTVPKGGFYLQTFLEAIDGLAEGAPYNCQSKHPDFQGWTGHLHEFLPFAFTYARQNELSVKDAMRCWGSGPFLLEVVPTVLYILEKHGHQPGRALEAAIDGSFEADTIAMLVGAALGALHGSQAGWFLDEELETLLEPDGSYWTGLI